MDLLLFLVVKTLFCLLLFIVCETNFTRYAQVVLFGLEPTLIGDLSELEEVHIIRIMGLHQGATKTLYLVIACFAYLLGSQLFPWMNFLGLLYLDSYVFVCGRNF